MSQHFLNYSVHHLPLGQTVTEIFIRIKHATAPGFIVNFLRTRFAFVALAVTRVLLNDW